MWALRGATAIGHLIKWFGRLVLALYLSTLLVFVAVEVSIDGGMAAVALGASQGAVDLSEQEREALGPGVVETIDAYHLTDFVPVRHAKWAVDAVQGDFNRSLQRNQEVGPMVAPRIPISLQIALVGLGLAIVLGGAAGFLGGLLRNGSSRAVHALAVSTFQATPAFILASFGTWFFAVKLGWLPAAGWERPSTSVPGNIERLIMPAFAIALPEAAVIGRLVMNSTQQVLDEEFILAAQAKGLPRRTILVRHALRPASMTLLTQIGLIFGSLLGGVIIVERMFGIGGLGSVLFEASINRDLHMLTALTSYVTLIVVVIRALTDVVYRWADPRIS